MRATRYVPAAVVGAIGATIPLHAQRPIPGTSAPNPVVATPFEATAGSELERYMRALQLVGVIAEQSVTLRGYAPRTLDHLRTAARQPWDRFTFVPAVATAGRRWQPRLDVLPLRTWSVFNQGFPFDYGDGAVWSGRGFTNAISAGVSGRVGPITFVLQPVAFRAENRPFALAPVSGTGVTQYADASLPSGIDTPQRFGDGAYGRVDPGQSAIRIDVGPVAAGVSTAADTWGPGLVHPLLMGQNAPGFRHVFLGTSGLRSVGIGRLNVKLVLGRPADSPYAPPQSSPRYLTGGVASFAPKWVPGLEIGGGRVFHRLVPTSGVPIGQLFSVFENFFQSPGAMSQKNEPSDPNYTPDNQVASAFAVWSHPRSGLRAYGEILKNDNNLNVRELVTEPDHDAAIMLGVEQAFARAADGSAFTILRIESVNARITNLDRVRQQATPYEHAVLVQGHTNRGQLLGSFAAEGGAGQHAAVDRYTRRGRLSLIGDRVVRRAPPTEGASADELDVQLALGAEAVRFHKGLDWFGRLRFVRELNRDYAGDASSWQLLAGATWRPNVHLGAAAGTR